MMFKSHFGETVTVVLAIVMGFIMALAVIVVDHLNLNFSTVFQIWSMVTLVILLVSAVIPYKEWSARLTALFGLPERGIVYRLADNILLSLILNTFNTVIVSAANVFFNEAIPASEQVEVWLHGIIHDWPITLVGWMEVSFADAIPVSWSQGVTSSSVSSTGIRSWTWMMVSLGAVVGDEEVRHGIVLAKNDIAKRFGVQCVPTSQPAKLLMGTY